ncbi:hypothetical protein PCANC_20064 [Puccinia coronata f. sp. avenae]|uniref:Uncharacterized protein n=1 Tax=Puccinia coronata f. sp. avenae TaxID=200324 RepID=A0A2N5SQX2_9BASI|nr:hypothetical protein PCASD_23560 [Puccinia coronata f. sp. avenae]PLW19243.1 hypothetical protein PCANC_20064 [Puccinia coronata f. sp. avenae]
MSFAKAVGCIAILPPTTSIPPAHITATATPLCLSKPPHQKPGSPRFLILYFPRAFREQVAICLQRALGKQVAICLLRALRKKDLLAENSQEAGPARQKFSGSRTCLPRVLGKQDLLAESFWEAGPACQEFSGSRTYSPRVLGKQDLLAKSSWEAGSSCFPRALCQDYACSSPSHHQKCLPFIAGTTKIFAGTSLSSLAPPGCRKILPVVGMTSELSECPPQLLE